MKSVLLFSLAAFISLSLAGFLIIQGGSHGHNTCATVLMNGAACPESETLSGTIAFHAGALRKASEAVPEAPLLALLLASLIAVIGAVTLEAKLHRTAFAPLSLLGGVSLFERPYIAKRSFLRWAALHEYSPSIA